MIKNKKYLIISSILIFIILLKDKVEKMIAPIKGIITSGYGMRRGILHSAIDIGANVGTPIKAPLSGKVLKVWTDNISGNGIRLIHNDNLITGFAHLSRFNVVQGQNVSQGDIIGFTGNTGNSTGPHLHFIIEKKNDNGNFIRVNPKDYVNFSS